MSYVTAEEFQKYTNVIDDSSGMQEVYIEAAQSIVSDYLGYDPETGLYDPDTGELQAVTQVMEIIRLTAMRIAALLQSEADSNIGVNSKSFGEGGTRVFTNFVNFDKYLLPVSRYKLVRI